MLRQPTPFFEEVRSTVLGPTLSVNEVYGCRAILAAMEGAPLAYAAYALATAYHETAHSMQPIKELGGDSYFFRMYDPGGRRPEIARRLGNCNPGDGARYCGRGYVQLTGRFNYHRAGQDLELQIEARPDLALSPDIAAKIMRRGMDEGWFSGHGFDAFLPASGPALQGEFVAARAIINGKDDARLIAGYAMEFQKALQAGEWV